MKRLQTARKRLRPEESLLSVDSEFYFNVRIIAQHMVRPISKLNMDHKEFLNSVCRKERSVFVSVSQFLLTLPGHRLPYGAAAIQMKQE